jgi:hypothetical protein
MRVKHCEPFHSSGVIIYKDTRTLTGFRRANQPDRLFHGGEIGTVDGGFEITGDIRDLEQAALLAYPGITPDRGN